MARVRVCQVVEATAGGVRRHLELLLASIDPDRIELACVVSCEREPRFRADLERYRAMGVTLVEVPMQRNISPLADLRSYRRLKAALAEFAPDVAHTHGSKGGFLGRLAARAAGVRGVVHTPHVFAFEWMHGARGRFYLALERYAARRCDRIVCLSEAQKLLSAERGLLPPEQLEVIANGVDPALYPGTRPRAEVREELGLPSGAPVVLMVARLMPQKGCRNFIRAAGMVARKLPEVHFCLIGDGPLESVLRAEVERQGIADRFHLAGHVEGADRLYGAFDLFVLSSLWEGLPYVVLEAMASRLAVVATRIPGTTDLVDEGRTGYLVTPDSLEEIAGRIVELMSDDASRAAMGETGRERVEKHFTLDAFARAHEALYEELAGGGGGGAGGRARRAIDTPRSAC